MTISLKYTIFLSLLGYYGGNLAHTGTAIPCVFCTASVLVRLIDGRAGAGTVQRGLKVALEIPKWLSDIFSAKCLLTEEGVSGYSKNAWQMNRVGELLAKGAMKPDALAVLIAAHEGSEPRDDQAYEAGLWSEIIGRKVDVPAPPAMNEETMAASALCRLQRVFLPRFTEVDYPPTFVKVEWGKRLVEASIVRHTLEGVWVLMENIPKPSFDDPAGYGDDPLALAMGLTTRFDVSFDALHSTNLPQLAKLLGVPERQVRYPFAEEWNLYANRLNWLREHRGANLPDLGSTRSWEWCENFYDVDNGVRIVVGNHRHGGLAGVDRNSSYQGFPHIGFRVVVVL